MSNSAFLTEVPVGAAYARVRLAGERQVYRLPLPFTVGTSPLCDVIVNVYGLAPVGRIVTAERGKISVQSEQGSSLPMPSALSDLGIHVTGPIAHAGSGRAFKTRCLELAAWEHETFARAPDAVYRFAGGSWSQKKRLSVWGAGLCLVLATGVAGLMLPARVNDLSQQAIPLIAGQLHVETIGSSKTRYGYERGATYAVTLPSTVTQLLSFEVGGLSDAEELTLLVNGHTAAVWHAEAECVESFCQKAVRLAAEVLLAGDNTLQFIHRGDSPYLLRKVLVSPLPVLDAAELASVDTWLAAARRAYDDRHILADNLVDADRLLKRAAALLGTRDLEQPAARQSAAVVTALSRDVDAELAGAVHDLWFKAEKHARLRERDAAQRVLATLLRLFPDPKDSAHLRATAMLKSLEEMRP